MQKHITHTLLFLTFLLNINILSAQETFPTPEVIVNDQVIDKTSVIIDEVIADTFGFIVIHAQDSEGNIGDAIGLALIHAGSNQNIRVELEMINVTPTLYAMLHVDTEPYGNYQFGEVEGADMPVTVNGETVVSVFEVGVISIHDQFIDPDNFNRIVVDTGASAEDAWLVAHAENTDGSVGEVLGYTFLPAGVTQNIPILLSGDSTDNIYIMLHQDTSASERYEFGEVENADLPLRLNDAVAMTNISTVSRVRFDNQLAIGSDLTRNDADFIPVVVDSVLSENAGWLVIYADNEDDLGDVLGFAPVQAGFNDNVIVEVPQADITPHLFAVLHEDTGEALVYEYNEVEDTDLPVQYEDTPVMDSGVVVPYISDIASLNENILTIQGATMDVTGWLVIHTDDGESNAGEVIGFTPLNIGHNEDIQIEIDPTRITNTLFAMLHYDSRPVGIYEFGTVEGADLPVIFEDEPVLVPLTLVQDDN